MSRIRWPFWLAAAIAFMAFAGLAAVALAYPNAWWASLFFTATLVLLCAAILGVVCRRGRAQMAWLGCALFGWMYFLMVFSPLANAEVALALPTTRLLTRLGNQPTPPSAPGNIIFSSNGQVLSARTVTIWNISGTSTGQIQYIDSTTGLPIPGVVWSPLDQVGHALWTLLAGALGACLTVWFAGRQPG